MAGAPNAQICDAGEDNIANTNAGAIEELTLGTNSTTTVAQNDRDQGFVWRVCSGEYGTYFQFGLAAELTGNTGKWVYVPPREECTYPARLGWKVKASATLAGDATAYVPPVMGSVSITGALPAGANNIGTVTEISPLGAPTGAGALTNGNGANVLASGNVGDAEALSVQVDVLAAGGVVIVEVSPETGTPGSWVILQGFNAINGTVGAATAAGAVLRYNIAGMAQWRVRQSAYTSGTTTGGVALTKGVSNIVLGASSATIGTVLLGAGGLAIGGVFGNVVSSNGGVALVYQLPAALATNNAALILTGARRAFRLNGYNAGAYTIFIKLFNKATAPTVGTDSPFATYAVQTLTAFDITIGVELAGLSFSSGLGIAIVKGSALLDNTAVLANDVLGLNLTYA